MNKDYLIEYTVKSKEGVVLKSGKMKVKNKMSELQAKVNLEDFLKKKYPKFGQLIIHKCSVDSPFDNIFGDIFGSSNPFNFK
jgi:hypothetical protein